MPKSNPVEFTKEVKSELKKVTWPSKKEMIASTIAVFIMVIIASLFLYLADQIIAFLVSFILDFGS
ncbi:MAG: preprotein translocase subunit SecE [Alphaproteobacteria bacterium]|nr:preprotein translocase subunit SecE [Alphaproteobacteria bacterium]NCQ88867.1 preprotein translocase subunit SecE [Alphaproteobacteria bacterium]NCT07770.1 preprotein translocase subunit SecE [Alphaproteobacteria bacterium]